MMRDLLDIDFALFALIRAMRGWRICPFARLRMPSNRR